MNTIARSDHFLPFIILAARLAAGCSAVPPPARPATSQAAITPVSQLSPMETLEVSPTPRTKPTAATPALGIGSTQVSPKDGMVMVFVPAGEFDMDGSAADTYWPSRLEPSAQ